MPRVYTFLEKYLKLAETQVGLWFVERIFSQERRTYGDCVCACGNRRRVRVEYLISGIHRSCGCDKVRRLVARKTHGMAHTRIYNIWESMKARCLNKNNDFFKHYGGRGISVCEKWMKFQGFFEDMGPSYASHLTIDRININGNYELSNCKWSTIQEQQQNTTRSVYLEIKGETHNMKFWIDKFRIKRSTVRGRLKSGWSYEEALTIPVRMKRTTA